MTSRILQYVRERQGIVLAVDKLHELTRWVGPVEQVRRQMGSPEAKVVLIWAWWAVCLHLDWLLRALPLLLSGLIVWLRCCPKEEAGKRV